jgi:hypothetical protein
MSAALAVQMKDAPHSRGPRPDDTVKKMQIPADRRLQRAQTFDEIAELYDRGRREPPSWLYETLFLPRSSTPLVRKSSRSAVAQLRGLI